MHGMLNRLKKIWTRQERINFVTLTKNRRFPIGALAKGSPRKAYVLVAESLTYYYVFS